MQLENLNQKDDYKYFEKILFEIEDVFKKIGININTKYLYYERKKNGTSILAIQLLNGNKNDKSNYVIFGCKASLNVKIASIVSCDVYIHADTKSCNYAQKIINLISKQIIEFFKHIKNDLCRKKQLKKEMSFLISFNQEKKSISDEPKNIKTKILDIIRKKLIKKWFNQ